MHGIALCCAAIQYSTVTTLTCIALYYVHAAELYSNETTLFFSCTLLTVMLCNNLQLCPLPLFSEIQSCTH